MAQNDLPGRSSRPDHGEERVDSTLPGRWSPASSGPRTAHAPAPAGHGHAASVVSSDAQLLAIALPFVEAGLRAGDLVALACPEETRAVLCEALGEQAALVESEARLTLLGARAPDAFAECRRYLERAAGTGSGRLRVLASVDFGDEPADWREGQRFESVANRLVDDAPVGAICLYDRRRLPEEVVASAAATHPLLVHGTEWTLNPAFEDPAVYVPALPVPHEAVEDGDPVLVVEDAAALAGLRRRLGDVLATSVPDPDQRDDLYLAMAEIAANAFRHGRPPVSARVWSDGGRMVCAITDSGTSWRDPFPGFEPAHGSDLSRGGMGLWLARKLWDHVDVLPGAGGLTIRLSTRLR